MSKEENFRFYPHKKDKQREREWSNMLKSFLGVQTGLLFVGFVLTMKSISMTIHYCMSHMMTSRNL